MKKLLQISILVLLLLTYLMIGLSYATGTCSSSTCTGTGPWTAASCSYDDVNHCVNTCASRGDTIIVPAGTCTWNSTLAYTKAITLQGAGAGNTIIKNGQSGCSVSTCQSGGCTQYLTSYNPSTPASDLAVLHRITGFTFDMQYQALGVRFRNRTATYPLTQISVDNNSFIHCWDCNADTDAVDPLSSSLEFYGKFEGVVYKNTFSGWPYLINTSDGADSMNYASQNVTIGSSKYMYYEDNYFDSIGTMAYDPVEPFLITADNGARIVVRYNEFNNQRTSTNLYKPWSTHHPAGGLNCGGKGEEFYGNILTKNSSSGSWQFGTPRSGQNLAFYNRIYSPGASVQWSQYSGPPVITSTVCGSGTLWNNLYRCDVSGQPQHIYKSYQFNNRYGNTGLGSLTGWTLSTSTTPPIREDTEYFNQPTGTFDGTTGVGCGTSTAMNAITPTLTGAGFWVPNASLDPTAASCSDISTWVGRNNTKAISVSGNIGTLYRWSGSAWVSYYTPYTYPHPLQGGDLSPPAYVAGTATPVSSVGNPVACTTDPQNQVIGVTVTENSGSTVYCRFCGVSDATEYEFPLKVNAAGYLEDQNDIPFFIQGDSPWFSMIKGTQEIITQYLDDRQARGFNALIMDLIEDDAGGPINVYGEVPFTTPGDFSTSNMATNAYWTHADWIINQAAARGMVVFLFPAYLGSSTANGFQNELTADTEEHIAAYGTAVGNRYKTFPNIVWVMGGDNDAGMLGLTAKHNALAAAIKVADANHIMTAHTKEGYDALNDYSETWLDLNTVYWADWETKTCNTGTASNIKTGGYDKLSTMPFVFFEGIYENTTTPASGSSDLCTRSQAYWSVLGGSPGYFFGNYPLYAFTTGWSTAMADDGSKYMTYMGNLLRSRSWQLLVPDYDNDVVTLGYGNIANATYVAAARTSDGETIIVYIPSGSTTITVDMTRITDAGGKVYAWWYDPSTGVAAYISEYSNTGSREFTTSTGDLVLVLDSVAAALGTPGESATSAQCNANTTYSQMPPANTFTNTNLVQTATITDQSCNASYTYYARCQDPTGNESAAIVISYSVDTDDDSTPPEIMIFRVDSNGRDLYLTADKPIKVGSGGSGGWELTKNGTDVVNLTFQSVIDRVLRYQTEIPILSSDTLAITYTQPTAGIQDLNDNDLVTIGSTTVVNDSMQGSATSTSLFDHGSVPTYGLTTAANAINLGVKFQSSGIGAIDVICFYKDASMDGETHIGTIYDSTGAVLRTHTFLTETTDGWQCEALTSPVGVLADVDYTVAVNYPSKIIYTNSFFSTPYTTSDGVLSASILNGRYAYSASSVYPTSVPVGKYNYWVDFEMSYQDAGGPWEVAITKTGTGCTYTPAINPVVEDGGSTTVTVSLINGWMALWGGTCSGAATGDDYYIANITADCTVELTCISQKILPWITP